MTGIDQTVIIPALIDAIKALAPWIPMFGLSDEESREMDALTRLAFNLGGMPTHKTFRDFAEQIHRIPLHRCDAQVRGRMDQLISLAGAAEVCTRPEPVETD